VSRYQKGKTNLDLLKQETASGSGISWADDTNSSKGASMHLAPDRQPHQHPITLFLQADALPAAQPTASKH